MPDLEIYDSQGKPLGAGPGQENERIKDYFFDGVRLALTRTPNGIEVVCFFRARESKSSRAEQYYAQFRSRTVGGMSEKFKNAVRRRIEDEEGMEFVTASDDTAVFETLGTRGQESPKPGDRQVRKDLKTLAGEGKQIELGVGGYPEALALLIDFAKDGKTAVISENTQNADYSQYDVLIKKGRYSGLELLGDTKSALEQLRKRRRRRRMGPQDQSGSSGFDPINVALGAVIGGGIIILLLYSACLFAGISLPVIGQLPGMDCGGDQQGWGANLSQERWQDGQLTLAGALTKGGERYNESQNLSLQFEANGRVQTAKTRADGGGFLFSLQTGQLPSGVYQYKISIESGITIHEGQVSVGAASQPTTPSTPTTRDPGTVTTETRTGTPGANETETPESPTTPEPVTNLVVENQTFPDPTSNISVANATYTIEGFKIEVYNTTNGSEDFLGSVERVPSATSGLKVPLNSTLSKNQTQITVDLVPLSMDSPQVSDSAVIRIRNSTSASEPG